MKNLTLVIFKVMIGAAIFMLSAGCKKSYNLPDKKSYISSQADYSTKIFSPILGRTTEYTNIFNAANSTFPMTFALLNPRYGDGRDGSDIVASKPTLIWTSPYTGKETSLAQIERNAILKTTPCWR